MILGDNGNPLPPQGLDCHCGRLGDTALWELQQGLELGSVRHAVVGHSPAVVGHYFGVVQCYAQCPV